MFFAHINGHIKSATEDLGILKGPYMYNVYIVDHRCEYSKLNNENFTANNAFEYKTLEFRPICDSQLKNIYLFIFL